MVRESEPSDGKPADYFDVVNQEVLGLVPLAAQRILEVGCAGGRLGEELKRRSPGCVVHGLERDPVAVRKAEKRLDRVYAIDLDAPLPDLDGPYDCITCADSLEHLVDPWSLLRQLVERLEPGGSVIASIPNVRYYPVIRDLVWGNRFTYRESGVLDATHLRFFTLPEMERLFESAGLEVRESRPLVDYEKGPLRRLDRLLRGRLTSYRAVQFVIRGTRGPRLANRRPAR